MTTKNNKNGRFLGHFQTFSFGLVGKAQEVKKICQKETAGVPAVDCYAV